MKITGRILQVSILLTGIAFILFGLALSEIDILISVNNTRANDLDAWKEFLSAWIVGIPEPQP
jgi:hypothetical protein